MIAGIRPRYGLLQKPMFFQLLTSPPVVKINIILGFQVVFLLLAGESLHANEERPLRHGIDPGLGKILSRAETTLQYS